MGTFSALRWPAEQFIPNCGAWVTSGWGKLWGLLLEGAGSENRTHHPAGTLGVRESECSSTSSSTFAGKYWKEVGTWSSTAGQGGLHSVVWKHTDSVPLSLLVRKHRITLPPYTMTKKVTRGKYSFCIKRRICNKKSAHRTGLGPPREDKLCVALCHWEAQVWIS